MNEGQLLVCHKRTVACSEDRHVPAEFETVSYEQFMRRLYKEEAVGCLLDAVVSYVRLTGVNTLVLKKDCVCIEIRRVDIDDRCNNKNERHG